MRHIKTYSCRRGRGDADVVYAVEFMWGVENVVPMHKATKVYKTYEAAKKYADLKIKEACYPLKPVMEG